jgi:hypothetical protein
VIQRGWAEAAAATRQDDHVHPCLRDATHCPGTSGTC